MMINIPTQEIKSTLEQLGAQQVAVHQESDKTMFVAMFTIQGAQTGVILIVSELGTQLFCKLFSTFEQAFNKPETPFYEVIDKLNAKLVIGFLQVQEQEGDYRLVYHSNHVADPDALLTNRSFRNFISFSVDMVGVVANELA
jgi:hypothetical protein